MTLRVPTAKVAAVGMRKLAEGGAGQARARDAQGPRPDQAHHVVAPRPGIRSQDQLRRHRRHRRGRARPVPVGHASPSSPTPSGSFTKPRSTGCRARSRRCSTSPRPRRSRRSRRRSPRALAAVRSRPRSWSRKRRRKPVALVDTKYKGPVARPGLLLLALLRIAYPPRGRVAREARRVGIVVRLTPPVALAIAPREPPSPRRGGMPVARRQLI